MQIKKIKQLFVYFMMLQMSAACLLYDTNVSYLFIFMRLSAVCLQNDTNFSCLFLFMVPMTEFGKRTA